MACSRLQIVGRSAEIAEIKTEIEYAAASDARVLITGEAGSGKQLIARSIHEQSTRAAAPFVTVDCAGIPDSVLEVELFGDARTTGANGGRKQIGLLELTSSGTVLLKRVAALSPTIQDRLVTLLDQSAPPATGQIVRPPRHARLMIATTRDLYADVVARELRADLYYRLNVIHLRVPPLRARCGDVALLVDHFLKTHPALRGRTQLDVPAEVMNAMAVYHWPGNVSELKGVIQRVVDAAGARAVRMSDFPEGDSPNALAGVSERSLDIN